MANIQMPDGNNVVIPDFSLESTSASILAQLNLLNKENKGSFAKLIKHAQEAAKSTERYYKTDEKDREDLYKATLDIAVAVRENAPSKLASKKGGDQKGVPGLNIASELSRTSDSAIIAAGEFDKVSQTAGGAQVNLAGFSETAGQGVESLDAFNKGAARGEKAFVVLYDGMSTAATAIVATAGTYATLLVDEFVGLGNDLNKLTESGAAFTDGLSQGAMSATGAMVQLSGMGLNAVGVMANFSGVMQSMGKSSFVDLTKNFKALTDNGADLGMSLEASVERMAQEMQKRQMMGVLGAANEAKMQKQIVKSIKTQQKYASVLGTSTDTLVAFTDSLLSQTPVLTANLMRMNADLRSKVIGGITDFGSTMRAMGGEEGGAIASAMTEAAASGAMGFSETMTGYIANMPSLAGPMNDYIKAIENGTLTQEDAEQLALDTGKMLANASESEKQRIFAMARAGDAQAESMAKAITQFETSNRKLKDINDGYTMDGVQKGSNTLTAMFKEFTGSFEAIKTSFLVGFGNVTDGGKSLADTFKTVKATIMTSINVAMEKFGMAGSAFDSLTGTGENLGIQLGKKLPKLLESAAEYVGSFIEAVPDIIDGIKSFASGFMSVIKVIGFVLSPVILAFKLLSGVLDFTVGVIQGAVAVIMAPFKLLGFMLGKLGDGIGYVWGLISPASDAVASGFSALGGIVSWVGDKLSWLGNAFKKVAGFFGFGGDSVETSMGKVAGATAVVATSMALMGKQLPGVVTDVGKKIASAGKGVAGSLKDKVMGKMGKGKTPATGDLGSKAMDSVGKKAGSLTASIGKGMSNLSKGIGDVLNNISKGVGSVISNLAKSVGKAGGALGKGLGDMVGGALKGIGKGLSAIGDPKALLGTVVLAALGGAMFVAGKAFQQFSDINWAGVGAGMVALGVLGVAAALLAPIAPLLVTGAFAIGVLGLALVPFAVAVAIAAPAMVDLMGSFKLLNDVDAGNVALMGPALVSLAVGMAAFSAGGLVGSIMDGLGSLFGADSPFDKIANLGKAAVPIIEMTKSMDGMSDTVESFNSALLKIDAKHMKSEFTIMAEGLDRLNESMGEISLGNLMKMAAMKSFGPVQQEQEEPAQPEKPKLTDKDYIMARAGDPDAQARVDTGQTQEQKDEKAKFDKSIPGQILADTGTEDVAMVSPGEPAKVEENPFAVPLEKAKEALNKAKAAQAAGLEEGINTVDQMSLDSDVNWAQMDLDDATKLDKEAAAKKAKDAEIKTPAKPKVDRSIAGRQKRDRERMGRGGLAEGVSKEDGDRARAQMQAPQVAQPKATVTTPIAAPTPAAPVANAEETEATTKSKADPDKLNTLVEKMVKSQEQTNRLLKAGNRTSVDIADTI